MKQKTFSSILIILCILVSLFPISVSAATVSSIVMSGDITPTLNQQLKFAAEPSHDLDDYTILQIWMVGEKMFTDSTMHNQALEDIGQLLPKSERIFKSGKSYGYTVAIFPGEASLADNLTVKLDSRELAKLNMELGKTYGITFYYDKKMHISSPNWQHSETEHWLACEDGDYVFDDTIFTHDFNKDTYTCEACGYVLPESMTTKITKQPSDITIKCGDTLELSTEAIGAELRYIWRWGDEHSLTDSHGMKVIGSDTPNLKIENFAGKYAEDYKGIYCLVEGVRGTAKTKVINITAEHNNNVVEPIDGNGHNVLCSCGKVVTKSEPHTYVNNKCIKCSYVKGSKPTVFKSATLSAPNFAHGKSVADSLETLQFDGPGIQSFSAEWLTSSHVPIHTGIFDANTSYILRVYPVFESNYYLSAGSTATIEYNEKKISCALISQNGKNYFNVLIGRPPENIKMTFEPNGGTGTQNPVYVDEYNDIYFPKCTLKKDGDEFFAWRVKSGDKYVLKSPDPERLSGYKIAENTTAEAIWDSQRIKDIAITMDGITEGKTVDEINFSLPEGAGYRFGGTVNWYLGDSTEQRYKLNGNRALSMNENYTIQIVLASDTGFGDDDLKVTLNNTTVTGVAKQGLEYLIITIRILNNVSVDFWEPMDGFTLATLSEITPNSDRFSVSSAKWYDRKNTLSGEQYPDGTVATLGKKYYLALTLQSAAENLIFGGDTIKVNGKAYQVTSRGSDSNKDSITSILEFNTTYPQVRISEDSEGYILIESPKDMDVTFAAVLYNSTGKMIDAATAPNFALAKGNNKISPTNIVGEKYPSYLRRLKGEKVKIMVLRSMNTLTPISSAHNYKYNYR